MSTLLSQIEELELVVPDFEKLNVSVSKSTVGWQVEHSLMVVGKTLSALMKSNPQDYKWQFNIARIFVFTFNWIPRGKRRAPKAVMPEGVIQREGLMQNVQSVRAKITGLGNLNANYFFEHPFLGRLNQKSTLKFLEIHTQHHLKIIRDILSKK